MADGLSRQLINPDQRFIVVDLPRAVDGDLAEVG
jgi:hypothetical protein